MATDDDTDNEDNAPMTEAEAIKHFATMQQAADDRAFFTDGELASVGRWNASARPRSVRGPQGGAGPKRPPRLQAVAHDARDSHIFGERAPALSVTSSFANAFKVLEGGNWAPHRSTPPRSQSKNDRDRPWVVLVTGLNGVRKMTATSPGSKTLWRRRSWGRTGRGARRKRVQLPTGSNSAAARLRRGDCCVTIEKLYAISDVSEYAKAKAAIFARYRTTSEMVGALLVEEASRINATCWWRRAR